VRERRQQIELPLTPTLPSLLFLFEHPLLTAEHGIYFRKRSSGVGLKKASSLAGWAVCSFCISFCTNPPLPLHHLCAGGLASSAVWRMQAEQVSAALVDIKLNVKLGGDAEQKTALFNVIVSLPY
jgi:hypothetical protein